MTPKSKTKKITLDKVIGTTSGNGHQLALSNKSSHYAHISGACVTITDYLSNKQVKFLTSKCEITAISFNYPSDKIASGDSSGELTCWMWKKKKKIWKIEKAHKGRILACEFDPRDEYLVTIGEDMILKIWSTESGDLVGANKISPSSTANKDGSVSVRSVAWGSDSKWIVTVGDNFVKYWFMSSLQNSKWSNAFNTNIIDGRKAALCDAENQDFISVTGAPDDPNTVYAVTKQGTLCSFGFSQRSLQKWVNLKTREAYSIHATEKSIIIGCSDGIVRVFAPKTLAYQGTVPKPPPIHSHLTAASINENVFQSQEGDVADAVSCKISVNSKYVAAIYSDRSFIMWDISNMKRITKYRSFLSHGGCIWDVDILPEDTESPLPEGTFVTCSEDGTIRFWNLNHDNQDRGSELRASIAEKSIFSRDLLHVVSFPRSQEQEDKIGIRCIKFLPNGFHVVSGDRIGNVRVHDVFKFNVVSDQCAHDSEVLTLDATQYNDDSILLASGSRDSLIHLYEFSENIGIDLIETLNNHTASITSVKFSCLGTKLMSCSADKTIVFRSVASQQGHYSITSDFTANISQGKVYDMDTDPTQKYIITSGSDRKLNIWNIQRGKSIRSYQVDKKAEPLKVKTDPAGIHAVTSSSDKILRLYDFYSGALYAKFRGHSGVINGIRFTNDCKRIISVGSDGCIFIWKMGSVLKNAMELRMSEIKKKNMKPKPLSIDDAPMIASQFNLDKIEKSSLQKTILEDGDQHDEGVSLILSDTNLPAWARPKTSDGAKPKTTSIPIEGGVWAQRIGTINILPTSTIDADVQSLHSMSQRSTGESLGKNIPSMPEEDDDVNLSEEESDSDKDEDHNTEEETQIVFANPEEDKEGFLVASADQLPTKSEDVNIVEEPLEPTEILDQDPIDNAIADESFDEENIRFVKENYGNLDKPLKRKQDDVRQSFSSAFFRQSILQMKLQDQKEVQSNDENNEADNSTPDSVSVPKTEAPKSEETRGPTPIFVESPTQDENDTNSEDTQSTTSDPGELAIKAGYGRVSNDTFSRNFIDAVGELDSLPRTPSDEDDKPTEFRDELRYLRKKYKIPTSISMSLKTQKAKTEATRGLEEYMKRRNEEETKSTATISTISDFDSPNIENINSEDEIVSSEFIEDNVNIDSNSPDKNKVSEKTDEKTDEETDEINNLGNANQTENITDKIDKLEDNHVIFEEKIEALHSPANPILSSPKDRTASPLQANKNSSELQDLQVPQIIQNSSKDSKEINIRTPTKEEEKKSATQELNNSPHLKGEEFPLPPRTPDVGQYSRMDQNDPLNAPRALHAFTPMPILNRAKLGKTSESIILKKSVDEYKLAMENLKKSFQTALSLYDEANTELQRSKLVYEIPKEEEKPVTDILEGFESVFKQMYSKIDQRSSLRESVSKETIDTTLEKYSDMLVQLVAQKMKNIQDK